MTEMKGLLRWQDFIKNKHFYGNMDKLLLQQFFWGLFWSKIISSLKSRILDIDFTSYFLKHGTAVFLKGC